MSSMGLPPMASADVEAMFANVSNTFSFFRGSVESASSRVPPDAASVSTDALFAAPPFLITQCGGSNKRADDNRVIGSIGSVGKLLAGSADSVVKLSSFTAGSTESDFIKREGEDKETDLISFPQRRSARRRGGHLGLFSSNSHSQDEALGGFVGLGSMTGSIFRSTADWHTDSHPPLPSQSSDRLVSRSRSTDRLNNFMAIIDKEILPEEHNTIKHEPNELPENTNGPPARVTRQSSGSFGGHKNVVNEFATSAEAHRPARAAKSLSPSRRGYTVSHWVEPAQPSVGKKRKAAAPAGAAAGAGKKRRRQAAVAEGSGVHVRERPDMQKTARMGQEHWMKQVKRMRAECQDRMDVYQNATYKAQIDHCQSLQIKSQHECLLRTLQMSAADKLITPEAFTNCDPTKSFLGWTGFKVVQDRAQEFRGRIDTLFPTPLKENTLHTAFRRAGLVPDKWSSGWLGLTSFRFSLEKRVAYAPSDHAAATAKGM